MLSDTKEKPFHCRYCGRRYARKSVQMSRHVRKHTDKSPSLHRDLVNRHERSFHPHADGLNLSERICSVDDRNGVTMSEMPNLPTPPSQTSETFSEEAHSQTRSPWNEESHTSMSLEMLSPHSDTMPSNTTTGKSLLNPAAAGSPSAQSVLALHHFTDNIPLQQNVIERDISHKDQYSPKTSHLSSTSLDFSGKGQWGTSNTTRSITGYEDWLPAAETEASHTFRDVYQDQNIFPDDFDLITVDSMALNHAALDADLSTYLHHSGPGPWDQILGHHAQNPGCPEVALSDSTSLPIEANALNAGIVDPGSPGILTRMPSLLKETPRKTLALPTLDENVYYAIMTSVRLQTSTTTDMEPLMSLQDMQQFLKCYLICFHKHCPVIHLPSLDLTTTPCHLILAMCAIGALYRLRRKTAHELWRLANQICEKVLLENASKVGCQVC